MTAPIDLVGQCFGELRALRPIVRPGMARQWLCQCSCGASVTVGTSKLVSGHTRSCGHLRVGVPKTHGDTTSREYNIWTHMIQRCTNKNRGNYHRYGGRGITVCSEWGRYENFLRDMGRSPSPDAQLDRIDNNGNYSADNCRWVTPDDNKRNRNNIIRIDLNGQNKTLREWSEVAGISVRTIKTRLARGWSYHDALTKSVSRRS